MDDEIKGEGNSANYKFRMHDTRVGRFFAVDPLTASFPANSSYAFSENSVIAYIEFEGLEKVTFNRGWGTNKESVTIDFTNLTDKQIEQKLKETENYHQGHVTLESIKSVDDKSYWLVTDGTILGGHSASTTIEEYKSIDDYKNGLKPFSKEIKRDISQYLYSKDNKLESDWKEGVKFGLSSVCLIFSLGTLTAATGALKIGEAVIGVVFSLDDLTELNGNTILTNIAGKAFGKTGEDFMKGLKFGISIRDAGKALVNVTVTSATGEAVNGVYDLVNDIFTIEEGARTVTEEVNNSENDQ
jgi:hypothetical protein